MDNLTSALLSVQKGLSSELVSYTTVAKSISSTEITINAPSDILGGNLLIAMIVHTDTEIYQLFTTTPTGWTRMSDGAENTGSISIWYKTATGSEPASYTWSGATVSRRGSGSIFNFSNSSVDDWGAATKEQEYPSVTLSSGNVNVTSDGGRLYYIGASEDPNKTMDPPTGFTEMEMSPILGMWIFEKLDVISGAQSVSTTLDTTGQGYCQMYSIQE